MNKYRKYSKITEPSSREVALTYGVKYVTSCEYKPNRHTQNRPFLVLTKEPQTGKIIALKLSSSSKKIYRTEYLIKTKEYDENNIMTKNSNVDLANIYELEKEDFIKRGFSLSQKDYTNILTKMLYLYTNNCSSITNEQAIKIQSLLYGNRELNKGDIIKIKHSNNYILIYDTDDKYYKGVELQQYIPDNFEPVSALRSMSYIDLDKEPVYIEKEEPFYIHEYTKYKSHILLGVIPKLEKIFNEREKALKSIKRLEKKYNIG